MLPKLFALGDSAASHAALPDAPIEATNGLEVIPGYRELQEQLQATLSAIEQNREETKAAAARAAAGMSSALQTVQTNFAAQRARDLEMIQQSNRLILKAATAFAAAGFVALLILIWLQWRMSRGLAEISSALPGRRALREGGTVAALGPAEQQDPGLTGTTGRHEQRPHELEQVSHRGAKTRKRFGRSIERRLFPNPGDSVRRRQFRALKTALILGVLSAGVVALVLYLVYLGPKR